MEGTGEERVDKEKQREREREGGRADRFAHAASCLAVNEEPNTIVDTHHAQVGLSFERAYVYIYSRFSVVVLLTTGW